MAIIPGLPGPPYLYDDPRFVYDELCLLYDAGGFDEVCAINNGLIGRKKPGGRSGGRPAPPPVRRRKPLERPPQRHELDLQINVQLCKLNDEDLLEDDECIEFEKHYRDEYGEINVDVLKLRVDTESKPPIEVTLNEMHAKTLTKTVESGMIVVKSPQLAKSTISVSSSIEDKTKSKVIIKSEIVKKRK